MDGGAIIANGSLVSIAGAEIINNTAAGDGGSIFIDMLANLTVFASVIFSGNTAQTLLYFLNVFNNYDIGVGMK